MTSSFSKKVHCERLPDDGRRPFVVGWHFRRGFPIGSDVDFDVPAVSRGVMGDAVPSAHVKLGRLDENSPKSNSETIWSAYIYRLPPPILLLPCT